LQEAGDEAPADEKEESCFFTSAEPHWGQELSSWDPDFCSFSNLLPHFSQTYSNIGMFRPPLNIQFAAYLIFWMEVCQGVLEGGVEHGQVPDEDQPGYGNPGRGA